MMKQRHLVNQGQRRVLGIQDKSSVYRGEIPSEGGTTAVTPTVEGPAPAQQFTGTLTAVQLNELSPWLLAVSLDSSGNTDLAGGYLAADVVKIHDDDDSHELSLVWNEAETGANRTLNFLVHGGNRTIDLYESLKVLDGQDIELHASGGEKAQLAIDTQNAERTLDLSENLKVLDGQDIELHGSGGEKAQLAIDTQNAERILDMDANLTVEADAIVSQDYSSDSATVTLAKLTLTRSTAELLDINPGFIGTGTVIDITPSAALTTEDAIYCGFSIDGTLLTPTSPGVEIDGIFIDFSAVTLGQTPVVHGLHVKMPAQETALHTDGEIHIDYLTGSSPGAEYTAIDVILDVSSLDANSEIHGLDIALAGSTSGSVAALGSHPGIDVIHQHVGTFGNINTGYTLVGSTYTAEAFTSATAIFAANGDSILIGGEAVFDEIQVTMTVVATKTTFPKFYYSYDNAGPEWTPFFPADDTEGFVHSGTIRMNSADLVAGGWEANDPDDDGGVTATKFYIKITRNRTASIGSPTATLKTLASTEYIWDKNGDVDINSLTTTGEIRGGAFAIAAVMGTL